MLFLLDANVLIDANRDYYPLVRVPEFWDWLVFHAKAGNLAIPLEIYEEVAQSEDDLGRWLRTDEIKRVIILKEEADPVLVSQVVANGYAPDLTDDEVEKLGRDPFLIAYALAGHPDRCVVTTEGSKPSRQRANRHVPDVCRGFNIDVCNTFELTRRLDFTTGRRTPST